MEKNLMLITGVHPKKPIEIVTGIGYMTGENESKELVTICNFPLPKDLHESNEQFEYARKFVSNLAMFEVCEKIMRWWKEHQYDTVMSDGDEFNVFNEEPDFVVAAREAIKSATK